MTEEQAIKKIKKIYADFLSRIKEVEIKRDQKVFAIIKKAEQRQIEAISARLRQK
ncbi:MAG: hypothetical protein PHU56_04320 [Candidatus Pacebacteria bacterium]|nr:hypothetical protein [Candidatus Paceibacterota bacterium]